jgi:hypothetical protein
MITHFGQTNPQCIAHGVVVTDLLDQQDKLVFESFYSLLTSASSLGAGDVVVTAD